MADSDWSEAKRARAAAARVRRRIIFNDDSHDLALADANTPEGFLAHRIAPLADTHVDTISWSVLCGQFDAPAYDSKVQPIYGDAHGGPMHYWPRVTANVKALARAGHCPLQLVVDFAHDHGMEAFASVRMNDVHDSFMGPNAMTVWKLTHQELLVDTRGILPEFELYTTAQDFSHPEVRERKLEIIGEICDRYDVDGFELDYIRHPVLFSRRVRGEPCSLGEIETITALMQEIRSLTDAAAARRGRPLLIAVRVPDTFIRCLINGLDVRTWLARDLTDIIIAGGGYAPWSLPAAAWMAAARPHGVPVYPCANVGWGPPLPAVRGLASNWYRAGADGLYFWNLATPFEFMTGDELVAARRHSTTTPVSTRSAIPRDCATGTSSSAWTIRSSHPAGCSRTMPTSPVRGRCRWNRSAARYAPASSVACPCWSETTSSASRPNGPRSRWGSTTRPGGMRCWCD